MNIIWCKIMKGSVGDEQNLELYSKWQREPMKVKQDGGDVVKFACFLN